MNNPLEKVMLKNGAEESRAEVIMVYTNLIEVVREGMLGWNAILEVEKLAHDPKFTITNPRVVELLKEWRILDDGGALHEVIKNVLLSAIDKSNGDLKLTSPIAEVQG